MIFQINGIDVHSRDQAIKLFSERTSDIVLLLARPATQVTVMTFEIPLCRRWQIEISLLSTTSININLEIYFL